MQKEKWDLFDKDGNHQGTFIRGSGAIPNGLYHKTVEIFPTDMEGHLLLTRRSMSKPMGAGLLEFPAGSVHAGENEIDAAVRELREETGLKPAKLYFLQKARSKGVIRYTYLAFIPDMTKQEIVYDPAEIMNHIFVSFKQWTHILTSREFNSFRTSCYNDKLMNNIERLVNKFATAEPEQPRPNTPLKANTTLTAKPRFLDERYYDKEPFTPENPFDEKPFEQGDDGS